MEKTREINLEIVMYIMERFPSRFYFYELANRETGSVTKANLIKLDNHIYKLDNDTGHLFHISSHSYFIEDLKNNVHYRLSYVPHSITKTKFIWLNKVKSVDSYRQSYSHVADEVLKISHFLCQYYTNYRQDD